MTCRDFVEFLMAYLDGELPSRQRALFEEHREGCEECEVYLQTYQKTIRLGELCKDPEGPVPEEVPEDLVRAVLEARSVRT